MVEGCWRDVGGMTCSDGWWRDDLRVMDGGEMICE